MLQRLEPRLSPGAIVVFDELINYPEFQQHELKALTELQARSGRTVRVLGLGAPQVAGRDEASVREYVRLHGEPGGTQSVAVQIL